MKKDELYQLILNFKQQYNEAFMIEAPQKQTGGRQR